MRQVKGHAFRKGRKQTFSVTAIAAIVIMILFSIVVGLRLWLSEGAATGSSTTLVQRPNMRYSHVPSVEWYSRPTIDINMVGEVDKGVTLYRTDFPGSSIGFPNFWDLVGTGGWERDTFQVLRFFLEDRPTDAYVDFGAWIGPTALYAAHYSKHVYAIEPDPMAYSALVANSLKNNHLAQNIRTYFECINTEEGPMTLRGKGDSVSRRDLPAGEGVFEWTIHCRTLPQFLAQEGVHTPRLFKIDIEGGELALLPSLRPWLETFKDNKPAIWLSIHRPFWDTSDPSLEAKMRNFWDAIKLYRYVYKETTFSKVALGREPDICDTFCAYLLTDEEVNFRN